MFVFRFCNRLRCSKPATPGSPFSSCPLVCHSAGGELGVSPRSQAPPDSDVYRRSSPCPVPMSHPCDLYPRPSHVMGRPVLSTACNGPGVLPGYPALLSCRVILPGCPARLSCRVILPGYPALLSFSVILPGNPAGMSCSVILSGYLARLSCRVVRPGYSAGLSCRVIGAPEWADPSASSAPGGRPGKAARRVLCRGRASQPRAAPNRFCEVPPSLQHCVSSLSFLVPYCSRGGCGAGGPRRAAESCEVHPDPVEIQTRSRSDPDEIQRDAVQLRLGRFSDIS